MRECCRETVAKVKDDEPVFVLRGQDKLSRITVAYWIALAQQNGVSQDKIDRAQRHLADIVEFQDAHPERCKIPD